MSEELDDYDFKAREAPTGYRWAQPGEKLRIGIDILIGGRGDVYQVNGRLADERAVMGFYEQPTIWCRGAIKLEE